MSPNKSYFSNILTKTKLYCPNCKLKKKCFRFRPFGIGMKLSRKRPVAGPQKEAASASATEAAGVAKKGQTKISRFFSKSLLPSLSDKATKLFQEKSEAKPEPEVDASAVAAPLPPAVAAAALPLLPAVIIENGENDVRLVSR